MKCFIIIWGFWFMLPHELQSQPDTLGRGLYTRVKTYEIGMANVWRNYVTISDSLDNTIVTAESYLDTVWMCCDTFINQKQYIKLLGQGTPSYLADVAEELWSFDIEAKKEFLIIPRDAPIGYNLLARFPNKPSYQKRIVAHKTTFKHFGAVFENVVAIYVIGKGKPYTYYYKRGVGVLACVELGKIVRILERNLFLQQP
jgi:hypothetical protein